MCSMEGTLWIYRQNETYNRGRGGVVPAKQNTLIITEHNSVIFFVLRFGQNWDFKKKGKGNIGIKCEIPNGSVKSYLLILIAFWKYTLQTYNLWPTRSPYVTLLNEIKNDLYYIFKDKQTKNKNKNTWRDGFHLPTRRWSKFLWQSFSGSCEHLFLTY